MLFKINEVIVDKEWYFHFLNLQSESDDKQIKLRKDSISEFEKALRQDLVEQNLKEIEVLKKYMPEQLSEEEINDIINEVFANVKPSSMKDMGMIMKEISPKIKGRADMGYVNGIIKAKLNNL